MFHVYSGIFNPLPKNCYFHNFGMYFDQKNHHHQETSKSLCFMLFEISNIMDDIMNITVYNSAHI